MTAAEDDPGVSLTLLRRQVAALLSQIDTRTLPDPDKTFTKRDDEHPGWEWNPSKGWRIFTIDQPDSSGSVYLDHDCNDITYRWGSGDWESMRVETARQIGMAFLAAAERAESQMDPKVVALHSKPRRRKP
jgi:hypothetical protein